MRGSLRERAPADMPRALYAYNHSWAYVDKVLAYAAAYGYVEPSSIPARAVQGAGSRVGAPYVWGAEGPDAFDCSGRGSSPGETTGGPAAPGPPVSAGSSAC